VLLAVALAMSLTLWWAIPLPNPPFPDCYSTVVLDRERQLLGAFLAPDDQWRFHPEALEVSPKLVQAVLTFEDRRFSYHPGIDLLAVARAAIANLRAGQIRSGASTLTMQVARLTRHRPRTASAKLVEMAAAVKLETRYSKAEILAMYLAHAPYGRNIVGAHAASFLYFGRPASRLTWAEAATLAVLPKAPSQINPFSRREELLVRRNRLLRSLHRRGRLPAADLAQSLAEPLPTQILPMPSVAPHLCRRMAAAGGSVVHTTIDRNLQETVEALAARHGEMLGRQGIHNLSVLVADTETGAVRAYVGSASFRDDRHGGQVDGIVARRSTGSLLKPFLYARCIDEGVIHPRTLIKDVPVHWGSFAPVNADHGFSGMVSAREALVRSLNVPPTILLRAHGVGVFHDFLRSAGMSTLFRRPEDYGLTLILGGAEGTLWDMVALFRGLGRRGRFGGLFALEGHAADPGSQLLSPAAAWMTLDMLTAVRRPDDDGVDWTAFPTRRPIAWKTGTSFGKRDGWALGVTPRWTVGTWAGNFAGEGNDRLGGARSAAPLLFGVIDLLPFDEQRPWFEKPSGAFRAVRLCAETGYRAGPDCPHPQEAEIPLRARPLPVCPFHRRFYLDAHRDIEVCSLCWTDADSVRQDVRLLFPADVRQFLRGAGFVLERHPQHNPACPALSGDSPVDIVYPVRHARLFVPRDLDGSYQSVTLRAAHSASDATLYWYLDGAFLGTTLGDHVMPAGLARGAHVLQVIDHAGHAAQVPFNVARN
jgi:penicillin-binding protein 1C